MIENFLNKRHSLRNLHEEEFYDILETLAYEFTNIDYYPRYDEEILIKDWKNLCKFQSDSPFINSTNRIGMKLCEHFFNNFYDISDKSGKSFSEMWKNVNLMKKILIWNRKSHSTPYLSEIKRGIYFCGGLTKSTMYRPQLAKLITTGRKRVLDPCAGWGGRMLGVVANNIDYVGFEPNTKTYENLIALSKFLKIENKVSIINDTAMNMSNYDIGKFDVCLTSPPYYNLEIYSTEETQSIHNQGTYEEWNRNFLEPLIHLCIAHLSDDSISCWNVSDVNKYPMWDSVNSSHNKKYFYHYHTYSVVSSRRQANQNKQKNQKSTDETRIYVKQ